jgi:hypothetical protein
MCLVKDKAPTSKTRNDNALPGKNHPTPETTLIDEHGTMEEM